MRPPDPPGPCSLVLFGASGDLTRRKLIPALWSLHHQGRLGEFSVIGVARSPGSDQSFRRAAREVLAAAGAVPGAEVWEDFERRLSYLSGDYSDPGTYVALAARLATAEPGAGRLYYLSTPPSVYGPIIQGLGQAGLTRPGPGRPGWDRIMVEKPFGRDYASARDLDLQLLEWFDEEQVYRIDHYLGKETVQNLLVLRFANGIFEPLWNRNYVDHVQISVAEQLGVEGRGPSYEQAGALRDMIQNHLLQMLCLVAMEPPASLRFDALGAEKLKVLHATQPLCSGDVCRHAVRGQYVAGDLQGREVPGYLEEPGVAPDSRTETYAALRLTLDNWRWAGVPFFLRTGKRLPERLSEVTIQFRRAPHLLFRGFGDDVVERNRLTIRIQPDEGIHLTFGVKVPGSGLHVESNCMRFRYREAYAAEAPEAYERLLLDCLLGDLSLFNQSAWMELSWRLMDPILQSWAAGDADLRRYRAGTWGPPEAEELLGGRGRSWLPSVGAKDEG